MTASTIAHNEFRVTFSRRVPLVDAPRVDVPTLRQVRVRAKRVATCAKNRGNSPLQFNAMQAYIKATRAIDEMSRNGLRAARNTLGQAA